MFRAQPGLRAHLRKSKECKKVSEKKCGCIKKEVWLVQKPEQKSPWDHGFISKEIFANALGRLTVAGTLSSDDHALLDNNDVGIENDDNENEQNENEENENEQNKNEQHEYHNSQENDDLEENLSQKVSDKVTNKHPETLICAECGKTFHHKRALGNHVDDNHTGTHHCMFCPKTYTKKFNLRRHIIQMHKENDSLLVCSCCGKLMSRKDYLKNHEKKCISQTLGKLLNHEKNLTVDFVS